MKAQPLQFSFHNKTYQFKFRIGFFILCAFFFILFCILGNWQLHRYEYKKNLQILFNQHLAASPKTLKQVIDSTDDMQFQTLMVKGVYEPEHTFLLQNQFYHDQLGFDVLTVVRIPDEKKFLLVDRGWISKNKLSCEKKSTASLGEVCSLPASKMQAITFQKIQGYIKLVDTHQFILGKNILDPSASPVVIQKINLDEISQITHQEYFPFILRLNANQVNGYVRDWTIVTVMPERHMAYAVQWFAMAFVLLIAYLCFCCERISTSENSHEKK